MSVKGFKATKPQNAKGGVKIMDAFTRDVVERHEQVMNDSVFQKISGMIDELSEMRDDADSSEKYEAFDEAIGALSLLTYDLFGGYTTDEFEALIDYRVKQYEAEHPELYRRAEACAL